MYGSEDVVLMIPAQLRRRRVVLCPRWLPKCKPARRFAAWPRAGGLEDRDLYSHRREGGVKGVALAPGIANGALRLRLTSAYKGLPKET